MRVQDDGGARAIDIKTERIGLEKLGPSSEIQGDDGASGVNKTF